jgi:ribonucleoside-triphosphate reductase
LGYKDNKDGRAVLHKVIETAVDVGAKKGKEIGDPVHISMTETEGSVRFATLDGEKYGKNSSLNVTDADNYTQGVILNATEVGDYTSKSEEIVECNKLSKILNGGLSVNLQIANDAKIADIKKSIEKTAELTNSFKLVRSIAICGECGFKDEIRKLKTIYDRLTKNFYYLLFNDHYTLNMLCRYEIHSTGVKKID